MVMLSTSISFAQIDGFDPTKGGTFGIGLEASEKHLSVLITTNAYHFDLMFDCSILSGDGRGSQGTNSYPSNIISSNGFPGDRYVDSYNRELHDAVSNSVVLKNTASLFTTVPEITEGETTFISDDLHYSDAVLQKINDYINLY